MSAEHELVEVRVALTEAIDLLRPAKCPDPACIRGVISFGMLRENWENCPWCETKKKLLDEHG